MTYNYSRYSLKTGRFTGFGTNTNKENVVAPEGQGIVEGHYDHDKQMVINGSVVDIPDKPDYPCHFDPASMQWVWDEAQSWFDFRQERNRRLSACDWTQVSDAPVDREAWATYRQALRDLPENTDDPRYPIWPQRP